LQETTRTHGLLENQRAYNQMNLPPQKQQLLDRVLSVLTPVTGVQAVVLGGSYARGTARPDSDLDIGIYYSEAAPFAIADIQQAAAAVSGRADQEVTDFYRWGRWVNGGGWLHTPDGKVDFLYRSIEHVERTIVEAQQGIIQHDFDQQPAYGFYSVIYLAETKVCLPLHDPQGQIARLKQQVASYPPLLKQQTVANMLWMAEFSLLHADGYASSGSVYAAAGTLTRVASYLTQALFALNETYFISDKTAVQEMAAFPLLPSDYTARLAAVLGQMGQTAAELQASVRAVRSLWSEVVQLTQGSYQPAFKL
jgi:predicted nucleotidyltransferase